VSDFTCDACGAEVLDIDVRCGQCGHRLTSTGAQQMLDAIVLGQYKVVDILGQGGMSVVYKGRHELTDQEVALKILPPELAAHSQVKSRFLEEARALAQLDHPNIVHLYNFGQENGCFVLAMQLIVGQTFERLILEAERLHWKVALPVAIEVLKALEYAHTRGIVHRDMKPSNVLIRDEDAAVTVMDFGIAKMTTSSRLTATGQTMGTVRYMSPEQVRGLEVDLRTDLYSLGGTLYEAVVGDTPFDGETHFEIMTKHLNEPPAPPSAMGIELPVALEAAILRSLAKKPADRYESARDFRAALEAVLGDEGAVMASASDALPSGPVSLTPDGFADTAPRPEVGEITGLASKLEPTGSHEAVTGVDASEVVNRTGGRRLPLWLILAAVVAVASIAVVVLVRASGGKQEISRPEVDKPPDEPIRPRPPRWPDPFVLTGVTYSVDKTYNEDRLRVMSVKKRDPEQIRRAYKSGHERFVAFLRERGLLTGTATPQPLTVVAVDSEVLCQARLYKEPEKMDAKAPPDCESKETFYRPREKTLFVADDDKRLAVNVAYNVAAALCLHTTPRLDGCTRDLLMEFDKRLLASPPAGAPTEKKPNRRR
jgi:serine/threonine protein kinase